MVVAACGAVPETSPSATARATQPASGTAAPSEPPGGTTDPGPTELPPTTQPSGTPTEEPTEEPSSTTGTGPAAACAGNDENRDFFAAVADSVAWPVYCPVLDAGWFVDSGQYRLAGGGWMEIAFRGPGGARIELREGAVCGTDGCIPSGSDVGEGAFGDLTGTLLALDGDRWAVVVDPGTTPSWTIVGIGLDQAAFERIAANLALVEG